MAPQIQTTISPYTQKPVLTRPLLSKDQLEAAVADAVKVQKTWRKVSLDDRIAIAEKWVGEFEKNAAPMAEDISTQMGR
jgi:acyl-CoA reductase-like NAD-dependent aldehyde dehydrogenase